MHVIFLEAMQRQLRTAIIFLVRIVRLLPAQTPLAPLPGAVDTHNIISILHELASGNQWFLQILFYCVLALPNTASATHAQIPGRCQYYLYCYVLHPVELFWSMELCLHRTRPALCSLYAHRSTIRGMPVQASSRGRSLCGNYLHVSRVGYTN